LKIGDVSRSRTIKQAISHCGLCGGKRVQDKMTRTPLSKQRNKHIQHVLVEAAKLAPRQWLAVVYEREKQKGNGNRATLRARLGLPSNISRKCSQGPERDLQDRKAEVCAADLHRVKPPITDHFKYLQDSGGSLSP
jgi:hypothetical protein